MVSIRSKKMKKFRTIKRETVFKPVEDARFEKIAALLNAPRPEERNQSQLKPRKRLTWKQISQS
ncbi:hypothetical protein BCR33DRAFT_779512 [Rhizoclosmatium globosum]|uniref:DUF2423 domain-containing protein n=1 Tax=Rhizoclosmatium globosum TaxID=329046 RepID=A0A1Y2D1R2_9FUNG|nr:hypothetical protein BCR33DRAFT_779512 [Rhizoclosmatium globosum]|eukprot:ORY53190.1 hypothetical protein BCR33DRAFT_779512 [Rhizoclosmatium globosum]